jgi:predicted ferric reductase
LKNDVFSINSKIIQIGLTLFVIIFYFYPAYQQNLALSCDFFYAIARGAGACLKPLLLLIFIPTLRMIHAMAYRYLSKLSKVALIGNLFHNRMSFHKILGIAIIIASVCHIIGHSLRNSVPWSSQEGFTGLVMMMLMVLPIGIMYLIRTGASRVIKVSPKMTYYGQFLIPHQLAWWGLIALFGFHTRDLRLLSWSMSIMILFSFDRIWEWIKSANVTVKSIKIIHEKMIVIEVDKPRNYRFEVGGKAYISFPVLSAFINQLHPFTLASSPKEPLLRFVISAQGKWSNNLIKTLKEGQKVRIGPAFPSSLNNHFSKATNTERLCITSGAGLAVTLAHLHHVEDMTKINIIHCSRFHEEFTLLNECIKDKINVNKTNFYYTGAERKDLPEKSPTCNVIEKGRFIPTESVLFNQFAGNIFYCGNDVLGKEIETIIQKDLSKKLFKEKYSF